MQLIYIYSSEFKSKEKGFHFSGKYRVETEKTKYGFDINIEKNDIELDSFLYGPNVKISAIIGDNGTGKSTMLDLIRFLEKNGGFQKLGEGFALWEDDGKFYIKTLKGCMCRYGKSRLKKEDRLTDLSRLPDTIYYSDLLESKYVLSEEHQNYVDKNCYDISTSYSCLFKEDAYINGNFLGALYNYENKKMFQLCHRYFKKDINVAKDFHVPRVLNVVMMKAKNLKISSRTKAATRKIRELENNLGSLIHYERLSLSSPEILVQYNLLLCILDIIQNLNIDTDTYNEITDVLANYFSADEHNPRYKWFDHIDIAFKDVLNIVSERKLINKQDYFEFCRCLKSCLNYGVWIGDKKAQKSELGTFSFALTNEEEIDIHRLNEFTYMYNLYLKIKGQNEFLYIDWGMSSGEYNMFSMFARINSAVEDIEKHNHKNVLLLIDEIDIAFHPKWQQEIIYKLSRFLNRMYPDITFQVILTTHSPVVLSDIPVSNVINLNASENSSQTFAANISSLYYSTLMMENGSIGKVSQQSIVKMFSVMNRYLSRMKENSDFTLKDYCDDWSTDENHKRRCALVSNSEYDRITKQWIFADFIKKVFEGEDSKNNETKNQENRDSILNAIESFKRCIDIIGEDIWRIKLQEMFEQCDVLPQERNEVDDLITQLRDLMSEEELQAKLREVRDDYDSDR